MNSLFRTALALGILIGGFRDSSFADDDRLLPPKKLRGTWLELEALDFKDWKIKSFQGWGEPFDGGSKVFFFETETGTTFEVMAANPAYWTLRDRQIGKQVFLVLFKKRYYRIEPESIGEEALLSMLKVVQPSLTGKDSKDPKLVESLIASIRSRKKLFRL